MSTSTKATADSSLPQRGAEHRTGVAPGDEEAIYAALKAKLDALSPKEEPMEHGAAPRRTGTIFTPRPRETEPTPTPAAPIASPKPSSADDASLACKPLLDAATKDLFRKNAFRVTGLSVDATPREIAKHADKLKVLAELGQLGQAQSTALPLKPPPTLDEIREAIQKLKEPEKRLIDEFFWFWPEKFGESGSDAAIQALTKGDLNGAVEIWRSKEKSQTDGIVATHNLAVLFHVFALDWENYSFEKELSEERRQKVVDLWGRAFRRWQRVAASEHLWENVGARIRQLNESNLRTGFARRMRATLPTALDKINAELAVAFSQSGKIELARIQVQFIRDRNRESPSDIEKTVELVLAPARNRLKEQIRRAKERTDKNPEDGVNAARDLLDQARDGLALFDLFFGKESNLRNDVFNEVAGLCNRLQITYYNATKDNKACIELLKTILPLATSIELRQRIEKDIVTSTENLAYLQFQLRIRNDEIEITPEKFRYNSRVLPSTDITGIRLGVLVPSRSSNSYRIGVRSASHGIAEIECKRLFRSEKQADEDFQAILGVLFNHIVPSLCSRLAKGIVAGARMPLGECDITSKGVHVTTGMFRWRKEHLIPWTDVRFGMHSGHLNINSAASPGLSKSLSIRDVWNAVIFKQLANEIVTLKASSAGSEVAHGPTKSL